MNKNMDEFQLSKKHFQLSLKLQPFTKRMFILKKKKLFFHMHLFFTLFAMIFSDYNNNTKTWLLYTEFRFTYCLLLDNFLLTLRGVHTQYYPLRHSSITQHFKVLFFLFLLFEENTFIYKHQLVDQSVCIDCLILCKCYLRSHGDCRVDLQGK